MEHKKPPPELAMGPLSRFAWPCLLIALLFGPPAAWAASETSSQGAVHGNARIPSFRAAKSVLRVLYAEHPFTLYSGCAFDVDHFRVDYSHCPYRPEPDQERGLRIEWEHIVPAEAFGRSFVAWREGDPACIARHGPFRGRRCASRASAAFRHIEADLYNLVPEIGELNQLRSNRAMSEIGAASCRPLAGVEGCIDGRSFMPRPQVKGDVARTYLYMHAAYPELRLLSDAKQQLFSAWSRLDPVDAWECRRAFRIEGLQGNGNPFVREPCESLGLWPAAATYEVQVANDDVPSLPAP